MAQLKDTIIQGNLDINGSILAADATFESLSVNDINIISKTSQLFEEGYIYKKISNSDLNTAYFQNHYGGTSIIRIGRFVLCQVAISLKAALPNGSYITLIPRLSEHLEYDCSSFIEGQNCVYGTVYCDKGTFRTAIFGDHLKIHLMGSTSIPSGNTLIMQIPLILHN